MLCVPRPSTSTWAPHCACCGRSAGRRCSACAQQRSPQPGSLRQPSWGIKTKAPLGHPAFARCSSPAAANSSSSSRCRCVRLRGVATLQRSLQRLRSPRHTAHTLCEPANLCELWPHAKAGSPARWHCQRMLISRCSAWQRAAQAQPRGAVGAFALSCRTGRHRVCLTLRIKCGAVPPHLMTTNWSPRWQPPRRGKPRTSRFGSE